MFEHSVRVPRNYKIAANIFKKVSTEGGSIKTLLYDNKLRHFNTNVLYALISETVKHAEYIDKIFESCNLFAKETRLDPWLAKILTAELLFGKKTLPGNSKPEQTIFSYKEQFEKYTNDNQEELKIEAVRRPRYVRVNTNLLTTSDAIRAFQDEGYRFVRCTSGSYDDYLKQIQELTEYDFTQDYHVKTMFIFTAGTKLHEHELYLENKIILQDKATAMAAHLLAPPPGSVVLDMCAAPGMKTTQLAAYMRNQGKIYAVERNEQRFQTLCNFVERTGSTCVETIHKDALAIRRGDYDDVEYILLDPSCSGSGMQLSVHNYVEDTRLAKLTSLQEKFLKHAMNAFPKAKRIVYSTCSLFPEENERVITNIVKGSRAKWRVQEVKELLKGQWNNFGSGMYGSIGARCMYARTDSDFTTGFFLAVLDRDQKDIEKAQHKEDVGDEDVKEFKNRVNEKHKKRKQEAEDAGINDDENTVGGEVIKKKKKKDKADQNENKDMNDSNFVGVDSALNNEEETVVQETSDPNEFKRKKKKKNKNKHATEIIDGNESQDVPLTVYNDDIEIVKKKKNASNYDQAIDEIQSAEQPEEINKKQKKKRKNEVEVSENESTLHHDVESETNDLPKKKKKKKRNKDLIETENLV